MTYAKLLGQLMALNNEQLNQDATVWDSGNEEFIPIQSLSFATAEDDVLDEGHPYIAI